MKGGLRGRYSAIFGRRVPGATRGFTVIEVLIVLAVSSGLFVLAAVAISGRQQRAQFDQSIQEIRSQIQQTINEVAVGYYPSQGDFTCTAGASGPVFSSVTSTDQGSNAGCVFLGKALQFDITGTDPEEFRVYTVAGLQKTSAGQEITRGPGDDYYIEAKPKVVSTGSLDEGAIKRLLYGLTVEKMYYGPAASPTEIGSFVIANTLSSYSSGSLLSGSQQLNVIPVETSALDTTALAGAQKVNDAFVGSPVNPSGGVHICFVAPDIDRSGLVTIGSNGRQLNVTLSIKYNRDCS